MNVHERSLNIHERSQKSVIRVHSSISLLLNTKKISFYIHCEHKSLYLTTNVFNF